MLTKQQVELARKHWEQARESALLAHDAWALLIKSHHALRDSYLKAGFPLSDATRQFEEIMAGHSDRYKAALTHMDNMSEAYLKILNHFKSQDG